MAQCLCSVGRETGNGEPYCQRRAMRLCRASGNSLHSFVGLLLSPIFRSTGAGQDFRNSAYTKPSGGAQTGSDQWGADETLQGSNYSRPTLLTLVFFRIVFLLRSCDCGKR